MSVTTRSPRAATVAGRAGLLALVLTPALAVAGAPAGAVAQEEGEVVFRRVAPADGWLGLSIRTETGLRETGPYSRITVTGVVPGGPADEAGLRAGDRVLSVGSEPATAALFARVASTARPGQHIRLTVAGSDGRRRSIDLTARSRPREHPLLSGELAAAVTEKLQRLDSLRYDTLHVVLGGWTERPPASLRKIVPDSSPSTRIVFLPGGGEAPAGVGNPGGAAISTPRPLLPHIEGRSWVAGARLARLVPDLAAYFAVERGVLVTEVLDGTPLPEAGIRPGDVVVTVDGRPVDAVNDVRRALSAADGVAVLDVVRRGERITVRLAR